MPIKPFESNVRGDTTPNLGPDIGLGVARQHAAAATEAGNKITAAGISITKAQVQILNKKRDQDDQINGFTNGVEFSELAAAIFQEEKQNLKGSKEPLSSRVEEKVRDKLESYADTKLMTPGARAEFRRRAAMIAAKINASAGLQEIADASVKRSMDFSKGLVKTGNQVFSLKDIPNGLREWKELIEFIENPESGFNIETQKILKVEASKVAYAAYAGLLEPTAGKPEPGKVLASLAAGEADEALSISQKILLTAKARAIEKGFLSGDSARENNVAAGQLARIQESDKILDFAAFPTAHPNNPKKQELHMRKMAIVSDVSTRVGMIGDLTAQVEHDSLQELEERRDNAPDDEILSYQTQITRYKSAMAAFEVQFKKDGVQTMMDHDPFFKERYSEAFKNNPGGTELEDLAIEAWIRRGKPANDHQRFTQQYIDQTLSDILGPYNGLNVDAPGAYANTDKTLMIREIVDNLKQTYGRNFSKLVEEWRLRGTGRGVPNAFYQAMMHSDNPAAFDYLMTAARLGPARVKELIPEEDDRKSLNAAILADDSLKVYFDQAISLGTQQDLKDSLTDAAFIISKNLTSASDKEIVAAVVKHFITNNNLSVVNFSRLDALNKSTEKGILMQGTLSKDEESDLKWNLKDNRNYGIWGIDKVRSGVLIMDDQIFRDSVTQKAWPRPNGDGTYFLTIPSDRGDIILRDKYGAPVSLTRDQLVTAQPFTSLFQAVNQLTEGESDFTKAIALIPKVELAILQGMYEIAVKILPNILPESQKPTQKFLIEHFPSEKELVKRIRDRNLKAVRQTTDLLFDIGQFDGTAFIVDKAQKIGDKILLGSALVTKSAIKGFKAFADDLKQVQEQLVEQFSEDDEPPSEEAIKKVTKEVVEKNTEDRQDQIKWNAEQKKKAAVLSAERLERWKDFAASSLTQLTSMYGWSKSKAAEVKQLVVDLISMDTAPEDLKSQEAEKFRKTMDKLSKHLIKKGPIEDGDEVEAMKDQTRYLFQQHEQRRLIQEIYIERQIASKTGTTFITEKFSALEKELNKVDGELNALEGKWSYLANGFNGHAAGITDRIRKIVNANKDTARIEKMDDRRAKEAKQIADKKAKAKQHRANLAKNKAIREAKENKQKNKNEAEDLRRSKKKYNPKDPFGHLPKIN